MNSCASQSFLVTKEHRRFCEFCEACRKYKYIGLCFGAPGVGKTISARQYARWDMVEQHVYLHVRKGSSGELQFVPPPEEIPSCHTLFYTSPVSMTPGRIEKEIKRLHDRFNTVIYQRLSGEEFVCPDIFGLPDRVELIIVDEAERAKIAGLEQLRDFYDRLDVGLVLIGMRGLEKQVARHPQFYSRVGFVHEFRPLSAEETGFILEHKWEELGTTIDYNDFTDTEAVAAVIRITGGNFRLIHRLCSQIARLMEINETKTITKELVEAARQSLIIGPT